MFIKSFVFNPFYENTYVLYDLTNQCIIIDPGCYEKYEQNELIDWIKQHKLQPKAVINTHCHIDHVLGNLFVKDFYQIPLQIPREETDLYLAVKSYAPNYGFARFSEAKPDTFLDESDEISFGNTLLKILKCPGHSPGHLVFYHPDTKQAIVGDVIFKESIGRTDLPGGDMATLLHNIKTKIFSLPEETILFPGHGPHTSVAHEATSNPFLRK